ncbi:MAG: preprotein translocase subunit SecG [Proteobacteria bacterium]|nr:preprotein translocase subunit SecG [Pseudomonadota bacterium]
MTFLLIIHAIVTLALIGVILLQQGEGGGVLGMGGGNSGNVFTARGAANLLTRITAVLAVLFMANALLMSIVASNQLKQTSTMLDSTVETSSESQ